MIYITRKEHFNAAHKLYRSDWSDEKNLEVFGKCSNPNWHGHNYDLYVTVKGEPDSNTGFVYDLKQLSEIIKKNVTDKLDHKNINLDVDFMKDKMASTEVLTMAIWDQLESQIKSDYGSLYSVRLHETERNYVEYFGPNGK